MGRIPVMLEAAISPNPNAMKFIADKYLIDPTITAEFRTKESAKGYSQLAEELFDFPYVEQVFIAQNFVTVTKKEHYTWDFLTRELRDYIRNYIADGRTVVEHAPEIESSEEIQAHAEEISSYSPSEFDEQIHDLFDSKINDITQKDGGTIYFRNYEDGVVTVLLKGACHACPISNSTMNGIKKILKYAGIPVEKVVAEGFPEVVSTN